MKRYEAMFLFDNTVAHDWPAIEAEVRRLCDRIGAEVLVSVKFDERKLAYEIKSRKRGTYALAYFDALPDRIAQLERDAQLSEMVLRLLVLHTDTLTEARLAELKAHPADQPLQPFQSDGRRGGDDRYAAVGRRGVAARDKRGKPDEGKQAAAGDSKETPASPAAEEPARAAAPADEPAADEPAAE